LIGFPASVIAAAVRLPSLHMRRDCGSVFATAIFGIWLRICNNMHTTRGMEIS